MGDSANGNITYLKREGDSNSLNMDSLYYNYESGTNKLRWVDDYGTAIYDNDIDDQNANNYSPAPARLYPVLLLNPPFLQGLNEVSMWV
jgi:hypothetical protein